MCEIKVTKKDRNGEKRESNKLKILDSKLFQSDKYFDYNFQLVVKMKVAFTIKSKDFHHMLFDNQE